MAQKCQQLQLIVIINSLLCLYKALFPLKVYILKHLLAENTTIVTYTGSAKIMQPRFNGAL